MSAKGPDDMATKKTTNTTMTCDVYSTPKALTEADLVILNKEMLHCVAREHTREARERTQETRELFREHDEHQDRLWSWARVVGMVAFSIVVLLEIISQAVIP